MAKTHSRKRKRADVSSPEQSADETASPASTAKVAKSETTDVATIQGTTEKETESAQQRVFQVTELLEAILLRIPWKDQFKCRGVCRQFRDVVEYSTSIKRQMWLLPRVSTIDHGNSEPEVEDFRQVHHTRWGTHWAPIAPIKSKWTLCPALRRIHTHNPFIPKRSEIKCQLIHPYVADDSFDVASWADFHLSDPPATKVRAEILWKVEKDSGTIGHCHYDGTKCLEDPSGFTIRKLLDASLDDGSSKFWSWLDVDRQQLWEGKGCNTSRDAVEKLQEKPEWQGEACVRLHHAR